MLVNMKAKPSTEYALLGSLMSGPMHGYEILRFFNEFLESTWHISTSQLYVLLKKLEKEGLLYSSVEEQENRPAKRVFELTPEGKEVFLKWVHSPTGHARDLRMEFLTKLFFIDHLSIRGGLELIDAQIKLMEGLVRKIEEGENEEDDPFSNLVFSFKETTIHTWIEWLKERARPFFKKV
jgi:DNA-binding PadR family transcriptional regulator